MEWAEGEFLGASTSFPWRLILILLRKISRWKLISIHLAIFTQNRCFSLCDKSSVSTWGTFFLTPHYQEIIRWAPQRGKSWTSYKFPFVTFMGFLFRTNCYINNFLYQNFMCVPQHIAENVRGWQVIKFMYLVKVSVCFLCCNVNYWWSY